MNVFGQQPPPQSPIYRRIRLWRALVFLLPATAWFLTGCQLGPVALPGENGNSQGNGQTNKNSNGSVTGSGNQQGNSNGSNNNNGFGGNGNSNGSENNGNTNSSGNTNGAGNGNNSGTGNGGLGTGKEPLPWAGPAGSPLPKEAIQPNGQVNPSFQCQNGLTYKTPSSVCTTEKATCVNLALRCVHKVSLQEGRFVLDGTPSFLRGVVYNPVPACKPYGHDFTDEPEVYKRDFPLLKTLGKNVVLRMLRPITNRHFLHHAYDNGLRIVAAYPIKWDSVFSRDCAIMENELRERIQFYQHHPAIVAYSIGEQVALHIRNSTITNKEQRIKDWYVCLNRLAGVVKQTEGSLARPVTTLSAAHPNEPLGSASSGAAEANLTNVDFHTFNVYLDTQVKSWLRGSQRKQFQKPVVIGSYGMDACAYNPTTKLCTEDQDNQARALVTLARDVQSAFDEPAETRAAGGFVMSYSDELWRGEPAQDICQQNSSGFHHANFFDGHFNLEWFGLVNIHQNTSQPEPRKAFRSLQALWSGTNPWPAAVSNVTIQSHTPNSQVDKQFLLWGSFEGFTKKPGESWAALFLLIRPFQGSDHYPMPPISLCCGNGPQEWMMAVQVGREQDNGKKFELVPAYTTNPATYQKMIQPGYFFTSKPDGLVLLKNQAVMVVRKP